MNSKLTMLAIKLIKNIKEKSFSTSTSSMIDFKENKKIIITSGGNLIKENNKSQLHHFDDDSENSDGESEYDDEINDSKDVKKEFDFELNNVSEDNSLNEKWPNDSTKYWNDWVII